MNNIKLLKFHGTGTGIVKEIRKHTRETTKVNNKKFNIQKDVISIK